MSKSQQIRDALAGGELPIAALHEKIGGPPQKINDLLNFLKTRGEIAFRGKGPDRYARLVKRRQGGPRPVTRKKHIERTTRPAPASRSLGDLLEENLIAAGFELRQVVTEQVEDLEKNSELVRAISYHARAEALYKARRD